MQLIRIKGPSMVPTLRNGDAVVVRRGGRIRVGDVVIGRFDEVPGLVVKRAVRAVGDRWWLESDNDSSPTTPGAMDRLSSTTAGCCCDICPFVRSAGSARHPANGRGVMVGRAV
nr:S24 family peptidase [Fodinicola feengrottensis]